MASDDPDVAIASRPGRQAREVGSGARLAEELTPRLLAGDDVANEVVDLRACAVPHDGWGGECEAKARRSAQRTARRDQRLRSKCVASAHATSVAVDGQDRRGPASEAKSLPPLRNREIGVPVDLEPIPQLIEGIVDLAFEQDGAWTVVDYKTDREIAASGEERYRRQIAIYAAAITQATGAPASGVLVRI